MIKILEKGRRKIAECEACGCKFSYDPEDVESMTEGLFVNEGDEKYLICPQCNCKIWLNDISSNSKIITNLDKIKEIFPEASTTGVTVDVYVDGSIDIKASSSWLNSPYSLEGKNR